ncbi:rRNA pseudouridine synthase [Candidatus Saccharibacteria bacterium]|nr:rRNA pseudouridine synthase [Candidatus Saccharibacteria bacterium]
MDIRLNKFLAEKIGLSRREADNFIADGKVLVNDTPAALGARISEKDKVVFDGKEISVSESKYVYLMLNKPEGYVSSRKRQGDTPTLYELLPEKYQKLKTVGRLDKNSSGLILLTNDGDFAFSHTHPKFYKLKTYLVTLNRTLEPLHQQEISDFGIQLEDGPSKLFLSKMNDARTEWQVEMSEGRNRQIRRTFAALGYEVVKLHRIEFGAYKLGDLKSGEYIEVAKK